jgi:hypothetical protein
MGAPADIGGDNMKNLPLESVAALAAGLLILVRPQLLNYVVAIYLIIVGILGLLKRT